MSVTNLRGTQWKLPAGTNQYWYTDEVHKFPLPANTKVAYKLSGGTENEVTYTNGGYIQWGSADVGDTASASITISSGATIPSYIYPPTDGCSSPYFYFMSSETNWWYNANTALYGGLDDSPIITFPDTDFTNADALTFFNNQGVQLNAHETKFVDATQLDADLTSVADAIRTKSGGSSQLAFPSGFVSEIGNIPTGGSSDWEEVNCGGSDYYDWDVWVIIAQHGNIMGASCTVSVASQSKTFDDEDTHCVHFSHVPISSTITWSGTGDFTRGAWLKMNNYNECAASTFNGDGSTPVKYNDQWTTAIIGGDVMFAIGSPET